MKKVAEFSLREILSKIRADHEIFQIGGQRYVVWMHSTRLQLYSRQLRCVICRKIPDRFVLECQSHCKFLRKASLAPYLGQMRFSVDHIVPKSRGGLYVAANLQTMCVLCNGLKGAHIASLETFRTYRRCYDIVQQNFEGYVEKTQTLRAIRKELGIV